MGSACSKFDKKADSDREQERKDDDRDQDDEPGKEENMFVFQS